MRLCVCGVNLNEMTKESRVREEDISIDVRGPSNIIIMLPFPNNRISAQYLSVNIVVLLLNQ